MALKLKLTFHGPNVVSIVTKKEPLQVGHAVAFETEILADPCPLADLKRFWEMERTFNELTRGRLRIDVIEVKAKDGPRDPH